jgi:ABC-type sugar transport system ATPase subunit
MTSVTLENVVKHYVPPVGSAETHPVSGLDHVNIKIEDGETVSVVGPSGCGKSTFLKVVAGLESADEGKIFYNKVDVTNITPQARGVGMVFQDYALYPSKEGEDNLGYYFEVRKKSEEEKEQRLRETAELMGIGFDLLMGRQVDTLSGGEKQRVGIARCIVREPNVFLMDEPISNLDAKLRERTRTEIKRLLKKFSITTIYVTHDQQEAIFMGDRIAVMRSGRIEQFGTFDDLYYSPANLFVATLIGTPPMSVIPVTLQNGMMQIAGASLTVPAEVAEKLPEGALRFGVRPEAWSVVKEPSSALTMSVIRVERLYTERAAFASGQIGGAPVNVLVALDFPAEAKEIFLQPDWTQVSFFAADSESALHTPGVPELF